MNDDDDAPVFPLLAYGSGITEGAIVLGLEMATDADQYESRKGVWVSTAMSPDNAMELGRELIALAVAAKAAATVN